MRINCVSCGTLFETKQNGTICQDCRQDTNKVFNVLRDYLYENPGSTVTDVVNETGLSVKVITQFLRDGRIETVGSIKLVHCESCGIPIDFGNLCSECQRLENPKIQGISTRKNVSFKKTLHTKEKKK
jgi:hypothetical protein